MTPSCEWPIQTFSTYFGTCICLRERSIICYMENCVAWFLIWSSLSVKHKLSSTDTLQLKSHIGKPFTTRESVKQMKDGKKCVNNPPCLNKLCFETFAWLQSTVERNANWCGLFWLKDDLCDHFIHNAMKAWGKIDSSENLEQQLYAFLEKVTFSKLLSFTVVTSLVTNGRVFSIYLSFLVMLILRV